MKLIIAIFGLIATVTAWDSVVSNFLSKVISKDSTLNIDNHALAFCGYEKHQCDTAPYCIWDVQSQICKRIVSPVPEQNLNSNFTQFASNYTNSTSNSTVGYNSTFLLESEFAAVNCTNQTFQNCSRTNGCAWNYTYNFCQLNNTRKFVLEQNSTSNYTNSTSGYNYTFTLESQQFAAVNCTNQTFYNCSKFNGCAWNYTRNICQLNNTRQFFLEQSNSTNSTGSFNVTLFDFNSFNYTVNSTQTGAQNFNLSSSYINQTESAFRLCNELNKTQCIYANNCKWARNNSCIYNNSTLQVPFVHKLLSLERD